MTGHLRFRAFLLKDVPEHHPGESRGRSVDTNTDLMAAFVLVDQIGRISLL